MPQTESISIVSPIMLVYSRFNQHHHGRPPTSDVWVFGIVDTSHTQALAYSGVATLPPVGSHTTVNHSLHLVDPATGVHTQYITCYLTRVKMKGYHAHEIPSYLYRVHVEEQFGKTRNEVLCSIFKTMLSFILFRRVSLHISVLTPSILILLHIHPFVYII